MNLVLQLKQLYSKPLVTLIMSRLGNVESYVDPIHLVIFGAYSYTDVVADVKSGMVPDVCINHN